MSKLYEAIRIKIKDKDANSLDRIYLIDKISDMPNYPLAHNQSCKAIQKSKILINESELIRILLTLNPENSKTDGSEYSFIKDIVVLKVGKSSKRYEELENNIDKHSGILYINDIPYKRLICASGHNRAKKIIMVRKDLFFKVNQILLCGIPKNQPYAPASKYNAYYGLPATDSIAVSMPNIVVIDDFEKSIRQNYDVVYGDVTKEIKEIRGKRNPKEVVIGHGEYSVENNIEKDIIIKPFDGAGLIDYRKAEEWKNELGLDYIPASFQFRAIPGIKGNLFVLDLKKFAEVYGVRKITDIWKKEWDLLNDKINCIMTRSQFKFWKLFSSYEDWLTKFNTDLYGYHRTFNISEYADACEKPTEDSKSKTLKNTALLCYQPLQTLKFTEQEIENLCKRTVGNIKEIHTNVESFLKYRGIIDNDDVDWSVVPSYYKALKENHSLFNDSYVNKKVVEDLKSIKLKSYVGKLIVDCNYQTLTPDVFGLAQYTFGLEVLGLLKADEIYSNYWNNKVKKGVVYVEIIENGTIRYFEVNAEYPIKELDLIRSPHIANEHCPVAVVNNPCMQIWYQYQKTGYLTSMYDTNLLKMNSADTDGDHVAGIYQKDIINAAKRSKANTIDFVQLDKEIKPKETPISNTNKLIETDVLGFKNDIGKVINKISILWSLPQSERIQNAIKVMSIIGSLTIDYVKTGQKADIPKYIIDLIKDYKKPYFMKYLDKKTLSKEKTIEKNIIRYDLKGKAESKFSNTDCTMNQICHYMENQVEDIKPEIKEDNFDFNTMIASNVRKQNQVYKRLRQKLLELQDEQYDITNAKYRSTDNSKDEKEDFYNRYRQFYAYAKNELLIICNDMDKLVDYLITIYYADAAFSSKDDKAILWNSFGEILINRCKGIMQSNLTYNDIILRERKGKYKESIKQIKSGKNMVNISFLNEKEKAIITKKEVKQIKTLICLNQSQDMNIKLIEEARRYFFVLLMIYRKLNQDKNKKASPITICEATKNQINYSQLAKLADIDGRHFDKIIKILCNANVVEIDTKNLARPKIHILFKEISGDYDIEIDDINGCHKYLNRYLPYSKQRKKKNVA